MTTAGDVNTQVGMASHVYLVTKSMQNEYFYSADSELLVVPQDGEIRFVTDRTLSLQRNSHNTKRSCLQGE